MPLAVANDAYVSFKKYINLFTFITCMLVQILSLDIPTYILYRQKYCEVFFYQTLILQQFIFLLVANMTCVAFIPSHRYIVILIINSPNNKNALNYP